MSKDKKSRNNEFYEDVLEEGTLVNFQLDTGSQVNVMPYQTFKKLGYNKSYLKEEKEGKRPVSSTKD